MREHLLVLGAGVSGRGAARLAARLGHRVRVYDAQPGALDGLAGEGFETRSGRWSADLLDGVELVVTSPGIPEHAPPIQDSLESGIPLWSEIELAWRQLDLPTVAVTGTNGKTTVCSLTARMLEASGIRSVAAGNIGLALSETVGGRWDVIVVEASSFQLRFTERFHPQVAVILNVAPDHLDWHGDLAAYAAAKARIFSNQTRDDLLVFDLDDPGAARLVGKAPSRAIPVSGHRVPEGGAGPDDGELILHSGHRLTVEDLWASDPATLVNVGAAATAAGGAGASPEGIAQAATAFTPAPHRRSLVATIEGVTFVDDSKATNPHAAEASVRTFPSVVLIAGGRNKDLDLSPLVSAPSIRHVVAIGEAGPQLADLAGPERSTMVGSMSEAVKVARALARAGDTVLLAPGCASFDMYRDYAERGDAFVAAVRELT